MLFRVFPTAANGPEELLNRLDSILRRIEESVHELEIMDVEIVEESAWYRQSRPARRTFIEKCATAGAYRPKRTKGPHLKVLEVADLDTARVAEKAALTSLFAVVENSESDRSLVKAAMRLYGTHEGFALCFEGGAACAPRAFDFENAGGFGEVMKRVRRRLNEATQSDSVPRIVVLIDGDGEWEGDVKHHAVEIQDECRKLGVPVILLKKRGPENYIPDTVWRAWAAEREKKSALPAVEALLRLSDSQRDYVDMKGRGTSPWSKDKVRCRALFSDVASDDEARLTDFDLKGEGDQMRIFLLDKYAAALSPESMRDRDSTGELAELARIIEDEL